MLSVFCPYYNSQNNTIHSLFYYPLNNNKYYLHYYQQIINAYCLHYYSHNIIFTACINNQTAITCTVHIATNKILNINKINK